MARFQKVQTGPVPIEFGNTGSIDALARLRTSSPTVIFDSKLLYDKQSLLWDEELIGTATSVHSVADANVKMSVSANADIVIRQTSARYNYQPGKTQQIFMSFNFGTQTASTTKRVGSFNSNTTTPFDSTKDGIYFEDDGSTFNFVLTKDGSATTIARASWDDPMDGSGRSEINLDFSKIQLLIFDYDWHGAGPMRVGFLVAGVIYYAHEFDNANVGTTVYMQTPNHSLRYEIRSTGGASSMDQICCSVSTEAGFDALGIIRSIDTGNTGRLTGSALFPLIAVRVKATHLDLAIKPLGFSIMSASNSNIRYSILFEPLLEVSGTPTDWDALTYTSLPNSGVEFFLGDPSTDVIVNEGTRITSGYVSNNLDSTIIAIDTPVSLGASIDGRPNTFIFAAQTDGNNESLFSSFTFRELT